jgi:hypothetical protein
MEPARRQSIIDPNRIHILSASLLSVAYYTLFFLEQIIRSNQHTVFFSLRINLLYKSIEDAQRGNIWIA